MKFMFPMLWPLCFCSGTLKRKIPSGLKQLQHSFYNKGGRCPPDSARMPCLRSDLRLAGKNVSLSLLQDHQNKKPMLTLSKIIHKHVKIKWNHRYARLLWTCLNISSSVCCILLFHVEHTAEALHKYPWLHLSHWGFPKAEPLLIKQYCTRCLVGLWGHILYFPS